MSYINDLRYKEIGVSAQKKGTYVGTPLFYWCRRRESNSHPRKEDWILSPARLPISPLRLRQGFIGNMIVDVNMIHGPAGASLRENEEWILFYIKRILDRIYRILRIFISFPGFPEESLETQSRQNRREKTTFPKLLI